MNILEVLFVAVALAMDTFAVSIASGIAARKFHISHAVTMGAWFGGFQAIMPFLGWLGGSKLRVFISGFDHWVAFGLLLLIGCKMIHEAFEIETAEKNEMRPKAKVMFVLALATSIDAFAVGLSFAMADFSILGPIITIGIVTFLLSVAGVWIGAKGFRLCETKVEIVAGLILIGIGFKILFSHIL